MNVNSMNAPTCGAGPSDVKDFDYFCRAQLAHTALFAQCVVRAVESLISAEGTGSEWRFVAAAVETGVGGGFDFGTGRGLGLAWL